MKSLYQSSRTYAEITTSLLRIPEQLKSMDPKYFVLYNHRKQLFEIHYEGNQGSTYCFDAEVLDNRVITEIRRTATHRGLAIYEELDDYNERMERKAKKDTRALFDLGERELQRILRRL